MKLKTFHLFDAQRKQKIRLIIRILQTGNSSTEHDSLCLPPRRIFINLGNNLLKRWDGQLDTSTKVQSLATPLTPKFTQRRRQRRRRCYAGDANQGGDTAPRVFSAYDPALQWKVCSGYSVSALPQSATKTLLDATLPDSLTMLHRHSLGHFGDGLDSQSLD